MHAWVAIPPSRHAATPLPAHGQTAAHRTADWRAPEPASSPATPRDLRRVAAPNAPRCPDIIFPIVRHPIREAGVAQMTRGMAGGEDFTR